MSASAARSGRPEKPEGERATSRTVSAYDWEWAAMRRIAKAEGYKTVFDLVRALMREQRHPLSLRGGQSVFEVPQRRKGYPKPNRE